MKILRGAAVVVLAGLFAAACSSSTKGSSSTTVATAKGDPNATIRLIVGGGPTQFDPDKCQSIQSDPGYLEPVYDQLVQIGNDGSVVPGLASSFSADPNNEVFTFKMRQANFQDGTPVNGQAVVANFERAKTLTGSTQASFLANMTSATSPSADTAVISFSKPYPTFPVVVASNCLGFMISPAAMNNANLGQNPVGAGGMKLVSFTTTQATYQKWNGYWDSANAWRYSTLIMNGSFNADPNAKIAAVTTGQYDAAFTDPTQRSIYQSALTTGYKLSTNLNFDFGLYINTKSNPALQNPSVLKALFMAINRDQINQSLLGGEGKPANQWLYPGTVGSVASLETNTFNANAAKQALSAAGVNSLSLKIIDPGIQPASEIITVVQQEFSQIGVQLQSDVVAGAAARATWRKGTYGGFLSVILTGPDPSTFVSDSVVGPDALGAASATTTSDANAALQLGLSDPGRAAAFQKVSQDMASDPISIPIIWEPFQELVSNKLLNYSNAPESRYLGTFQDPRYLEKTA